MDDCQQALAGLAGKGVKRRQGLGVVDHGRAAAHVDGDGDGLQDLVARRAVAQGRPGVIAETTVTPGGDADGQRDQFLGFWIKRAAADFASGLSTA